LLHKCNLILGVGVAVRLNSSIVRWQEVCLDQGCHAVPSGLRTLRIIFPSNFGQVYVTRISERGYNPCLKASIIRLRQKASRP
jgi:hypothetical protein